MTMNCFLVKRDMKRIYRIHNYIRLFDVSVHPHVHIVPGSAPRLSSIVISTAQFDARIRRLLCCRYWRPNGIGHRNLRTVFRFAHDLGGREVQWPRLVKAMDSRNVSRSRHTSIVVIVLETDEVYIIASLSTGNNTQVIYVDPTTGNICYTGKKGHDLFVSENEALNHITDGSRWLCKRTTYARAIMGYAAVGNTGMLLLATKVTATIPNLPGGGCVYTVSDSQWIKIQLQNAHLQGKGELKNIQELAELDIVGKYYFCETLDITRPFPSKYSVRSPDMEFVWNTWLSLSFNNIGLPQHCVVLLQGFAEVDLLEFLISPYPALANF